MHNDFSASINQVDNSLWYGFLAQFADSTIYQTCEYGQTFWGESHCKRLVLEDGSNPDIPASIALVRRLRVPFFQLHYLRWGPLWRKTGSRVPDIAPFGAMLDILSSTYACRRNQSLRIIPAVYLHEPWAEDITDCLLRKGFMKVPDSVAATYNTIILPLELPTGDLLKGTDHRWRSNLYKAEKSGLRVSIGEDKSFLRKSLSIYHELLTRKRVEPFIDIHRYARLQEHLPESSKLKIILTELHEDPVSFIMFSLHGDTAIGLFAGTSAAALKTNASYLSWWKLIEYLKERKVRFLDFGGINKRRNPGVYQFKAGLSGKNGIFTSVIGTFEKHGGGASRMFLLLLSKLHSIKNRGLLLFRK